MKTRSVTIIPDGRSLPYAEGSLLADILTDLGIHVPAPCGGRGLCGKCLVRAEGSLSEVTETERRFIGRPGERLACQARGTGDFTLHAASIRDEEEIAPIHADKEGVFGIAVDIGTTSIQASLVDIRLGSPVASISRLNPQRRFGHDVISRISAAVDKDAGEKLTSLLRSEVQSMARRLIAAASLDQERISTLAVSGNTSMLYFLLGLDVAPLGTFPYRAGVLDFSQFSARDIGLDLPRTGLRVFPAASAFLGGDLTAGLAFTDAMGITENTFFIDLGTNGEIFVRSGGGGIFAASCAMGPALEGMGISCGMTATNGAITHVTREDGALRLSVMGGKDPAGISGTGVIDLIAILLADGSINASGAFKNGAADIESPILSACHPREKGLSLGGRVCLTQKDIRSVQLAKGASLSASLVLLSESGLSPDRVKSVIIAGAFGENLDLGNFRALGFIPDFRNAEHLFLGNTSLRGAERACADGEFIRRAISLRDTITAIDLNSRPDFNDLFIESLGFRQRS